MGLPEDLKDYSADSFVIFTRGEILALLCIVLAGALLLDAWQRWFA